MSAAPAIVHDAHTQWLMRRRTLITAADVAAVLHCDVYGRKEADVYVEKIGLGDPDEESWPLYYGNEFQGPIGRAFARKTGRRVRMASQELPEITVHPDIPFLGATLDGEQDGCDASPAPREGVGVLEVKATSVSHTWDENEMPVGFQVQAMVQMACAGRAWGSVAAFTSLRHAPRHQDIVFDAELFNLILPRLEEFHQRVQRRDPPLDQPDWWSSRAIRRVFADDSGEPIALDHAALQLVEQWENAKADRAAADREADRLSDELRLRMGSAPIGYLPDGSALTLKTVAGGPVSYTREAYRRLHRTKKGRK